MKAAIIIAILFCAGLIGFGIYEAVKPAPVDNGPRTVPITQSYADRQKNGYWVEGSATPKVTVVEYSDFQCPYCGVLSAPLQTAISQSSDYVQLQYHSFPLTNIHNKTVIASHAAEAAGRQDKFWPMHDKLFGNQTAWADQTPSAFMDTVNQYAGDLGLDVNQFKRDMNDPSLQTPIDADVALGSKVPVTGTPTLVVNGTVVKTAPVTVDGLLMLFQNARDGKLLQ